MSSSARLQCPDLQPFCTRKQRADLGEEASSHGGTSSRGGTSSHGGASSRRGWISRIYAAEGGEATIEFLGVVLIFVIPVFYLIISLGLAQSAYYACETSARNGARILADDPSRIKVAQLATHLTFQDYDVRVPPQISVSCEPHDCRPGGRISVSVSADVPLPFLPEWLSSRTSVTVDARATMPVSGVELK